MYYSEFFSNRSIGTILTMDKNCMILAKRIVLVHDCCFVFICGSYSKISYCFMIGGLL